MDLFFFNSSSPLYAADSDKTAAAKLLISSKEIIRTDHSAA